MIAKLIPVPVFIPQSDGTLPLWLGLGIIGAAVAVPIALWVYWWMNP